MDSFSKEKRSEIMSRVRSKNTRPEILVRKLVFSLGFRYRLHRKDLPGKPDLVFPGRKKIIFVHGCFWHGHRCKKGAPPKSRLEYWLPKIAENKRRDRTVLRKLKREGWSVLIIWQCQLKKLMIVRNRIETFLSRDRTENG